MTIIRTFIVEPGTPELAICARWRANAFSVLRASFEQEMRSMELFASDQGRGVALIAKADGEPIGTCLLAESEIEPNHDVSPWLAGLFVVPEHRRRVQRRYWFVRSRIKRGSVGFRGFTSTPQMLSGSMRGSGWSVLDHTHWKGFDTALMACDL
jgi:hypothetical protein